MVQVSLKFLENVFLGQVQLPPTHAAINTIYDQKCKKSMTVFKTAF